MWNENSVSLGKFLLFLDTQFPYFDDALGKQVEMPALYGLRILTYMSFCTAKYSILGHDLLEPLKNIHFSWLLFLIT